MQLCSSSSFSDNRSSVSSPCRSVPLFHSCMHVLEKMESWNNRVQLIKLIQTLTIIVPFLSKKKIGVYSIYRKLLKEYCQPRIQRRSATTKLLTFIRNGIFFFKFASLLQINDSKGRISHELFLGISLSFLSCRGRTGDVYARAHTLLSFRFGFRVIVSAIPTLAFGYLLLH